MLRTPVSVLPFLAAVALAFVPAPAHACLSSAECEVRGAECREQSCRLVNPRMLIPTLDVTEIELVSPGNLATLPDGTFDLEGRFPPGADELVYVVMNAWPEYSEQGELANKANVVWYWSSVWGGIAKDVVEMKDLRAFRYDGEKCENVAVAALKNGIYHWAALGKTKGQVTHQSAVRTFSVGPERLTGRACSGSSECQSSASTTCYDTQGYCVLRCASDLDCFENTGCDLTARTVEGFPFGVCRPNARCDCPKDWFCDDDTPQSLDLCYAPPRAAQGEAGCGCPVGGGNTEAPPQCFAAGVLLTVIRLRRRLRER